MRVESRVWSTLAWLALTLASPAVQRGDGGVQFLLGGGIFLHQRRQAIVVLLRLEQVGLRDGQVGLGLQQRHLLPGELQIGFALREIAFGLLDRGLVRALIQNVQHIAGVHFLAGTEEPFFDIAVHASADVDRVAGVGLRRVFGKNRHVGGSDFRDQYAGRGWRLASSPILGGGLAP